MSVRVMLCGLLCAALLASCFAAALARYRMAPADEYFGRSKMSILEINNRLREGTYRARRGVRPSVLLGDAQRTQDAMYDWSRKYPADPWLSHYWWRLASLYSLMPSATAHQRETLALVQFHSFGHAR
ncbi:MAG: hypothetical protein M3R30_06585 [Candidatus Eremiobacteraeota bacterium]|nr:hypothetical protein [Candidatus Eremiobacteraeota bacterium]